MPAKSKAQYNFMQMIAHGGKSNKKSKDKKDKGKPVGPSPEVARDFISKTPPVKRREFAKD